MKVYNYDDFGVYVGFHEAQPSPLEPGKFLIPVMATTVEPPENSGRMAPFWDGEKWVLKIDPMQMTDREAVESGYVVIPKGYVLDGEKIRVMTPSELGRAGFLDLPVLQSILCSMVDGWHTTLLDRGFDFKGTRFSANPGLLTKAIGLVSSISSGLATDADFPQSWPTALDTTFQFSSTSDFIAFARAFFLHVKGVDSGIGQIKESIRSASKASKASDLFDKWEASVSA